MFKFSLLGGVPWENGIEPDTSNDQCDVYVEEFFTKSLKKTSMGEKIPKMKDWYVALVKFKDGYRAWIISDGKGVLDEATSVDQLGVACDKWKLIVHGRA